jgi:hypothetical protein
LHTTIKQATVTKISEKHRSSGKTHIPLRTMPLKISQNLRTWSLNNTRLTIMTAQRGSKRGENQTQRGEKKRKKRNQKTKNQKKRNKEQQLPKKLKQSQTRADARNLQPSFQA